MKASEEKKRYVETTGVVIQILGNNSFKVRCPNGKIRLVKKPSKFARTKRSEGVSSKIFLGSNLKIKFPIEDLSTGVITDFIESHENKESN